MIGANSHRQMLTGSPHLSIVTGVQVSQTFTKTVVSCMTGATGLILTFQETVYKRIRRTDCCAIISGQNHCSGNFHPWRGGDGAPLSTWPKNHGTDMENDRSTILISTCCECKRHFGVKPGGKGEGGETHGYCEECFRVAIEKLHAKRAAAKASPS